jgi:hypothetical protein
LSRSARSSLAASRAAALAHLPFNCDNFMELAPPVRRLAVDLNYLFHRQQMERSLAQAAESSAARAAHEEMARQYEMEIERKSGGQIAFPWLRQIDEIGARRQG